VLPYPSATALQRLSLGVASYLGTTALQSLAASIMLYALYTCMLYALYTCMLYALCTVALLNQRPIVVAPKSKSAWRSGRASLEESGGSLLIVIAS
jgi:hypothetical protein